MRGTLNIIETAQKQNLPIGMVTLDAEKAFDKVMWPYLFETLSIFRLHTTFINWLKAMYRVRVNGVMSNIFKISKGTRQGDPLFYVSNHWQNTLGWNRK